MRRSTIGIILALALGCLVAPRAAEAQQPVKVHRIGVLSLASAASNEAFAIEALRQGLRELGYVEGQNLTLEVRWAEGRHERLDDLAAELVRLPVDLIVTAGPGSGAARRATTTLPIVVAFMGYGQGSVESQARPGGNLTGLFMPGSELEAKRLELLKEAFSRRHPGGGAPRGGQPYKTDGAQSAGAYGPGTGGDAATGGGSRTRRLRARL